METDACVNEFTHLEDKYNAAQASHLLKRVASLVKPLMKKRSWVLPLLSEFFPDNPNLQGLNVNAGQQILLRLRPAHDSDALMREEAIVQTMLHELAHNVHGEHNAAFYKYLTVLQDEYSDLVKSGHDGDGFFSTGHILVSSPYEDISVPPNVARIRALEAAQKRANTLRIVSTGGRLGGRSGANNLSRRELVAQAAERRLTDDKKCGAGAEIDVQAEIERAMKNNFKKRVNETQDVNASSQGSEIAINVNYDGQISLPTDNLEDMAIGLPSGPEVTNSTMVFTSDHDKCESKPDAEIPNSPESILIASDDTSKESMLDEIHPPEPKTIQILHGVNGKVSRHFPHPRQLASMPMPSTLSSGLRGRLPFVNQAAYSTMDQRPPANWRWPCSVCKVKNEVSALACTACAKPKSQVKWYEKGGWTCHACAQGGISQSLWTCIWCGEMKLRIQAH